MVERKVTVVNPTGLHLRPAGLLCQTSMKFDSKVMIFYKEKEIKACHGLANINSGYGWDYTCYFTVCEYYVSDRVQAK